MTDRRPPSPPVPDGIPSVSHDALERVLVEHGVHGILVGTGWPPRLLYANRALADILGMTREAILRASPQEMVARVHPDDREAFFHRYRERLAGDETPRTMEFRVVRPDGDVRWVDGKGRPILVDGRRAAMGVFVDITERKRMENALRMALQRNRRLLDTSLDGFILTDTEGNVRDVNPAYCEMVGYAREELLAMNIRDLDVALDAEQVRARLRTILERRGARFETRHRHRDGRVVDLDVSVSVLEDASGSLLAAFVRDVTQAIQAERRARESAAHYRTVFRESPVSLWEEDFSEVRRYVEALRRRGVDDIEAYCREHPEARAEFARRVRVVDVNDATLRLYRAASKDELLGGLTRVFTDDAYDVFIREIAALAAGSRSFQSPARQKTLDGRTIHVDVHVYVGSGFERTWERVFVSVVDVTETRRLHAQLLQAQKMEAVGRLAGGVAHDLNNLLTVINGFSELIAQEAPPDGALARDIDEIRRAGRRAESLTRQLLAFSRKQVMRPTAVDLRGLVDGFRRLLRRVVGENVEWVVEHGEPARVWADRAQLEQVFMNLVVNARDAMPDGGRITLRTGIVRGDDVPESLRAHEGEAFGWFEVADTGVGMGPDVCERVFEPFFTTKDAGQGSGLGLSTAFGIVEQSGGSIEVDSEPGRGSRFRVYLPVAPESTGEATRPARRVAGPVVLDARVLVVEDEAAVRRLVVRALRRAGCRVVEASSGEEGLRCVSDDARFDLVFTDVVMPGMSGYEMASRMRDRGIAIPVLYTTGYSDEPDGRRGAPAGAARTLRKPFTTAELVERIAQALGGAVPPGAGAD